MEAFPELREGLTGSEDAIEIDSVYELWFELLPMVRAAHDEGNRDLLRRIYDYAHWSARHPSEEIWNPVGVAFLEHLLDDPETIEDSAAFLQRLTFPVSRMPEEVKKLGESQAVSEARMQEILSWLDNDVIEDVWGLWQLMLRATDMDTVGRLLREQNRPVPGDTGQT